MSQYFRIYLNVAVLFGWLCLIGCNAQNREDSWPSERNQRLNAFVTASGEELQSLRTTMSRIKDAWRQSFPESDFDAIETWATRMIEADTQSAEIEELQRIIRSSNPLVNLDFTIQIPVFRVEIRTKEDVARYLDNSASQLYSEIQDILRAQALISIIDSDSKSAYTFLHKAFEVNELQRLADGLNERIKYNRNMMRNIFLTLKCTSLGEIPQELKYEVRRAYLFSMWDVHCLESQLNWELTAIMLESPAANSIEAATKAGNEIRALNRLFVDRFKSLPGEYAHEEFSRQESALLNSDRKEHLLAQLLVPSYSVILRSEWDSRAHLAFAMLSIESPRRTPEENVANFEGVIKHLFVPSDWVSLDFSDGTCILCEHRAESESLSWSIAFKKHQ